MIYYFICILIFLIVELLFRKIEIKGGEKVPKKSGFIIASNHVSYFDPPVVGYAIWRSARLPIYFLAKSELGKTKLLRWFFKHCNVVFIRRGESDRNALVKALALLNEERSIVIFPEGSTRPERQRISSGLGYLSINSGQPILPVKIEITGYQRQSGFWHFLRMIIGWFFGPGKVKIKFGQLIPCEKEDRRQITNRVMEVIRLL